MLSESRLAKITSVVEARQEGIVIIEDPFDPHNAEAAVRSCDAFGIQKFYLIFNEAKAFNPKKIGKASSATANKWLTFKTFSSTKECLEEVKKEGYEIVATILDDTSESLFEAKLTNPKTAILLGNEAKGLTEEAIKLADRKVIIPMKGMVQSLNLSVTASLFLFELTRQREEMGIEKFLLPKTEQTALLKDFSER